jgi:hypothetical protein
MDMSLYSDVPAAYRRRTAWGYILEMRLGVSQASFVHSDRHNYVETFPHLHLKTERDPVAETLCTPGIPRVKDDAQHNNLMTTQLQPQNVRES